MKKKSNRTRIIAEIGPNHNGSLDIAKKMIKLLSKLDIDVIKFQLGNPNEVYSDDAFKADYQKKNDKEKTIKKMSQKNQLKRSEHLKLSKLCRKKNIHYACTAFDLQSLKFLDKKLKVPFFKISSGEVTSLDMINYISKQKKPIILSTGMSEFNEIKKIKRILEKYNKNKITILHCVSEYPAKIKNINLNILDELKKRFKCDIGYSDHTIGEETCISAVAKGAKVIEKHVTLSKSMIGPDHKTSSTIKEFEILVNKIRNVEKLLGHNKKKFSKEEIKIQLMAKKSCVTINDLKKNHVLTRGDVCFKRPGTGISPLELNKILGKRIVKDIKKNKVIEKKMINFKK